MAFQSKKDGPGVPVNKLAVEEATTLAMLPTMAQPLSDPSPQTMAKQTGHRQKRHLEILEEIAIIVQ
jgi:hypothetical protein